MQEGWGTGGYSQSITVPLCLSFLLTLCSSVGSSTGCSPVRKICSSVGSPQVAVPLGISICSGVLLSAGCREYLFCHGEPSPPFSDLEVTSHFSLFLFPLPLSLWCFLPFFKMCFQRGATHTLGWWAELWLAMGPLGTQQELSRTSHVRHRAAAHLLPRRAPCSLHGYWNLATYTQYT